MRILVLVCSCNSEKSFNLRKACRETWLQNHDYFFFVGGPNEEPDVLSLDVEDDYKHLPMKMKTCFRRVLDEEWDFIFKCDDDTYVNLDRLPSLGFDWDFIGNPFLEKYGFASGGAGYLISRKMVEAVLEDDIPDEGPEDLLISHSVMRNGGTWKSDERLIYNFQNFPTKDNDIISCHWINPRQMKFIWDETPLIRRFEVIHKEWQDKVLLYEGGFLKRATHEDHGVWFEEDNQLFLKWDKWSMDMVKKLTNGLYMGENITMVEEFIDIPKSQDKQLLCR